MKAKELKEIMEMTAQGSPGIYKDLRGNESNDDRAAATQESNNES